MRLSRSQCSDDQCERDVVARGFCRMHYKQARKQGLPLLPPRERAVCTIVDCCEIVSSRGLCETHRSRWRRHGDTETVLPKGGKGKRLPRKEVLTYSGLHQRVNRWRGAASDHTCVDCGESAEHWSLTDFSNVLVNEQGYLYSMDVGAYMPRCVSCHKVHDLKAAVA